MPDVTRHPRRAVAFLMMEEAGMLTSTATQPIPRNADDARANAPHTAKGWCAMTHRARFRIPIFVKPLRMFEWNREPIQSPELRWDSTPERL
jgi:hypothetical protein